MASLSSVDWILLAEDDVTAGDFVSVEAGGMPLYRVIAVEDDKAWVSDDRHPMVRAMPLARLRWKAAGRQPLP
jgi:hypothetical protein